MMNVNLYPHYQTDTDMLLKGFELISLDPSSKSSELSTTKVKKIGLAEGQDLFVETGEMLAYENLTFKSESYNRSFSDRIKLYLFGGESPFFNRFAAKKGGGWISLEEQISGQIIPIKMKQGQEVKVTRGAFIASTENVMPFTPNLDLKKEMRNFNFSILPRMMNYRCEGKKKGLLLVGSTNINVQVIRLTPEMGPIYVDNKHFIALSGQFKAAYKKINDSYAQALWSGEGLMLELTGKGKIYLGSIEKRDNQTAFKRLLGGLMKKAMPYVVLGSAAVPFLLAKKIFNFAFPYNAPTCLTKHSTKSFTYKWIDCSSGSIRWLKDCLVRNVEADYYSCCCSERDFSLIIDPLRKLGLIS